MTEESPHMHNFKVTTWYGLPADITVTEHNIHRVVMDGVALPHPGVVNIVVRRGLSLQARLEITALHEFGHLQTLPVPILHLLLLLWPRQGRPYGSRKMRTLIILITHQLLWEVTSESYVIIRDKRAYQAERPLLAHLLYGTFWTTMTILSLLGTLFLLQRKRTLS